MTELVGKRKGARDKISLMRQRPWNDDDGWYNKETVGRRDSRGGEECGEGEGRIQGAVF